MWCEKWKFASVYAGVAPASICAAQRLIRCATNDVLTRTVKVIFKSARSAL
jgi:hypothetical protein